MHLAMIIDDYLPHSTRVGAKMFHELASYYVSLGHRVTVITPVEKQKEKLTITELDGVTIWGFSTGPIKNTDKIKRGINESLLSYRAWRAIAPLVDKQSFDGIIYYSPSIFFGTLVHKIKTLCQCPSYLILRDAFPQWLIDTGIIKQGSLIESYFRFFEKKSYAQADSIGLMSKKNQTLFDQSTQGKYQTNIVRNWAKLTAHQLSSPNNSVRKRLNLTDKVIYFYGGNIGHAQDMGNLMRLAKAMQTYPKAHFLFVGQGDEVELINQLSNEWSLKNFTYLPSVNQEEFKDLLAEIDVGLFSLSKHHTAHNFPGKLLGYMVQSLPILGSVNQGNDLAELVNHHQAGFITNNGEDEQLLNNAIGLLQPDLRQRIGKNAYQLLCDEFALETTAKHIIEALTKPSTPHKSSAHKSSAHKSSAHK